MPMAWLGWASGRVYPKSGVIWLHGLRWDQPVRWEAQRDAPLSFCHAQRHLCAELLTLPGLTAVRGGMLQGLMKSHPD